MAALTLEVVTPERVVFSETVDSVVLPGVDGRFGVLAEHAPLVAGLAVGAVEFGPYQGKKHLLAISGGFAEVSNNRVTVLADTAERPEEIDVERARAARERAERRLADRSADIDRVRAEAALRRALNRLYVAENG